MSSKYLELLLSSDSHSDYRPGDKVVLQVVFSRGGKIYCYTADSGKYYSGEKMLVWTDGKYTPVTIVMVHYFYPEDYPFTQLRLKKAIRKEDRTKRTAYNSTKVAATTKSKAKKPEKKKPDWLLEENEEDAYKSTLYRNSPTIKSSLTVKSNESANNSISYTRPVGSTNSQISSDSTYKPKSHKMLIALIIIAAIGLFQGPTWYSNYLDKKPLYNSDVVGTWEPEYGAQDVVFSSDHSVNVRGEDYLTGKWEITSESQQTIRLYYIVTDSQLDKYNEDFYYEMEGYIASKEDVLEWELEYAEDLPPEGTYKFKRSDNRLIYVDYDDYYLEKR